MVSHMHSEAAHLTGFATTVDRVCSQEIRRNRVSRLWKREAQEIRSPRGAAERGRGARDSRRKGGQKLHSKFTDISARPLRYKRMVSIV